MPSVLRKRKDDHEGFSEKLKSNEAKKFEVEDDSDPVVFSFLDIIRMLGGFLFLNIILSKYFTGTMTYGYNGKLIDPHYLRYQLFGKALNLTELELQLYNGTDPDLPLYIAVNGTIFDVSSKKDIYGPAGSYHFLAGIDSSRALATNCLNHLTHDIRDIRPAEERRLNGWIEYFDDKYFRVGVVQHPPLTGQPPSREDCKGKYY